MDLLQPLIRDTKSNKVSPRPNPNIKATPIRIAIGTKMAKPLKYLLSVSGRLVNVAILFSFSGVCGAYLMALQNIHDMFFEQNFMFEAFFPRETFVSQGGLENSKDFRPTLAITSLHILTD